jgi:hypothetical protein
MAAKIVCVLYPDPVDGYPPKYLRDSIPCLQQYPGGQSLPTPEALDFTPGELVGCVSGELGLRKFLEDAGNTLVVTSDKDGGITAEQRRRVGGRDDADRIAVSVSALDNATAVPMAGPRRRDDSGVCVAPPRVYAYDRSIIVLERDSRCEHLLQLTKNPVPAAVQRRSGQRLDRY